MNDLDKEAAELLAMADEMVLMLKEQSGKDSALAFAHRINPLRSAVQLWLEARIAAALEVGECEEAATSIDQNTTGLSDLARRRIYEAEYRVKREVIRFAETFHKPTANDAGRN